MLPRLAPLLGLLAALAAGPATVSVRAQEATPPLALHVVPQTGELRVELGDLLQDGGLRRALHQGLPLRIGVRAELWRDGFFDSQKGAAEWKASVVLDPVGQTYRVEASEGAGDVVSSLADATAALQRLFALAIAPEQPGRYYYLVTVEIATLSLSDLEELQRWLRGDLAPAVTGDEDVGGALGRGVRRLFVRALGLPARRLQLRSETFEVGAGG